MLTIPALNCTVNACPAGPGCVLEGRVAISEELQEKINALEAAREERINRKKE